MKKMLFRPLMLIAVWMAANLTACISLAADVTPPPDFQPTEAVQPAALDTIFPAFPPDPSSGAAIYAEKCLPCHGATGMGDGPQSGNLPNPPPQIGSPDLARISRPVDWFSIVTQGNLQKMMPGFSDSLDDRQRWDVVAYVYSLSMPAVEIEQGKQVYDQNCASCHGDQGQGSANTASWSEQSYLAKLSAQEIHDLILNGSGQMPAFSSKLDDSQVWAASSYVRSQTFAAGAPSGQMAQTTPQSGAVNAQGTQAATPPAEKASGPVTISGTVINGSGGTVPAGLKVTLHGFDQMQPSINLETQTGPDGAFKFENVETNPDRVFMAVISYNDYSFNSDILHASDISEGNSNLTLQVYETTTDPSGLIADRMHVFFDFSQPGIMQVGQLYIISNSTHKMVVAEKAGEAVLKFELPQGASNLSFQDGSIGDRYIQTENGFGDTAAIPPGSGSDQVLFAYDLPYDRKLDVSLTSPIPVDAAVIIAPAGNIKLQSPQLQDAGVKSMQDVQVHLYTANSLAAGSQLNVSISGRAGGGGLFDQSTLSGLLVGLGALIVAVVVVLLWMMRRRAALQPAEGELETGEEGPKDVDSLVDAILALDDQYQAGEIAQEAYDQRRAELKEHLRDAREREQKR